MAVCARHYLCECVLLIFSVHCMPQLRLPALHACRDDALQVHPPVEAFRVQSVEEVNLHPIRFFEYLDARGQWEDFSYRKCIG